MPTPREGESRSEFVGRCVPTLIGEGRKQDQAVAICNSMWEKRTLLELALRSGVMVLPNGTVPVRTSPRLYKTYMAIFGDEGAKDLYGTYFTRDTNFYLDWYRERPWLYHHGMHPMMGAVRIGSLGDPGIDEHGLFFLAELDRYFQYREDVELLLDSGIAKASSGAISYLVDLKDSGEITDWPIMEGSATVAPAEFRIDSFEPQVQRAIRTLEDVGGRNTMKLSEFFKGVSLQPKAEVEAETEALDQEQELEQETETPDVEPEVDLEELARALAPLLRQDDVVKAIQAIDERIKGLVSRQEALGQEVAKLRSAEQEKVAAILHGENDWFRGLFSITKAGTEGTAPEDQTTTPVGDVQVGGQPIEGGDPVLTALGGR